jgi:UTP--glucose-1-phosphate uridylyltransferase
MTLRMLFGKRPKSMIGDIVWQKGAVVRTAILLLGGPGLGTRMWPLSLLVPKGLLPVGTCSLLQHAMSEAAACGINSFVLSVDSAETAEELKRVKQAWNRNSSEVPLENTALTEEWFDLVKRIDSIVWSDPRAPSGIASGILSVEKAVDDQWFAVLSVDDLMFDGGLRRVMQTWQQTKQWSIGLTRINRKQFSEFGVTQVKQRAKGYYQILSAKEKPGWRPGYSGLGIAGRYIVDRSVFRAIRACRTKTLQERSQAGFHLTECLDWAARRGKLVGSMVGPHYFHTGTMKSYLAAWRHFLHEHKLENA